MRPGLTLLLLIVILVTGCGGGGVDIQQQAQASQTRVGPPIESGGNLEEVLTQGDGFQCTSTYQGAPLVVLIKGEQYVSTWSEQSLIVSSEGEYLHLPKIYKKKAYVLFDDYYARRIGYSGPIEPIEELKSRYAEDAVSVTCLEADVVDEEFVVPEDQLCDVDTSNELELDKLDRC